jgi:signal peptidase II
MVMFFWIVTLVILVVDQGIKYLVLTNIATWESIPLIPGVLHLTHVQNPGAAFGLLADWTGLFIVVTLVVVAAAVYYYRWIVTFGWAFQLALALEVGGAVGNMIDRIRFGHVVDFIDLQIWPVFNIADMAIVSGVLIVGYILLQTRDEKRFF